MADTHSKPIDQPSIADLRATIRDIDALSQEGFSQISAIASLALLAMKDDPARNAVDVEHALRVICGKANDIEDCINAEAERVGCNHVNPSFARIDSATVN